MIRCRFGLLAVVIGGLALPALADDTRPPACASIRSIDSWKQVDDTTAIIGTSPRRTYKVTFLGSCREMKQSLFARIEARPSTGLMCLSPGDVMIFGRGQAFPAQRFEFEERCVIKAVEPIQPKPEDAPSD